MSYLDSEDKPVVDTVGAEVECSVAAVEVPVAEAKEHCLVVERCREDHDLLAAAMDLLEIETMAELESTVYLEFELCMVALELARLEAFDWVLDLEAPAVSLAAVQAASEAAGGLEGPSAERFRSFVAVQTSEAWDRLVAKCVEAAINNLDE